MGERFDVSSLAEGLSGFSAPFVTNEAYSILPKGAHEASALREVPYANLGPLVSHLNDVVRGLIEASTSPEGGSDHTEAAAAEEKIQTLCFAISSTIGTSRLNSNDEAKLWGNTKLLWDASLEFCERGGPSTTHADKLHSLGSEIFQLIQDNCDPAHLDASEYVRGLCKAAEVWARLGNTQRASWCVVHAVRYAEKLQELMASDRLPQNAREGCVLQLFDLYLQAAQNCAASKQQSMANNMLARALQLSKHEIVGAGASAHMSLGIAELQVEQAQGMVDSRNASTALVLLRSAEQHLDSAAAACADVADGGVLHKVHAARESAAITASEAHMATGNAQAAVESLQQIQQEEREVYGFSSLDARMVRAKIAAGDVTGAAQLLTLFSTFQYADDSLNRWIKAFEQVLGAWSSKAAPNQLVTAAISFAHAVHGEVELMQSLLRCILSSGSKQRQEVALKILAADEIVASICQDASLQAFCDSMLRTLGAQAFNEGSGNGSIALATAMFQYAPSTDRRMVAGLVAAAHLRAENIQRCLEYLDVAAQQSGPMYSIELMMKIVVEIRYGDPLNAIAALRSLDKCHNFHYTSSQAMVPSTCGSSVPLAVRLEGTALAVRTMIPAEPTAPTFVSDGVEGGVLRKRLQALLHAASDTSSYDQLAATLKTASKRLKVLGLQRFTGGRDHVESIASLGYTACLAALEAGAYVQCVKITSSTCVVLAALKRNQGGIPPKMEGFEVRVLMTGAQAALCSADDGDRSKKFSSATQMKVAGLLLDQAAREAAKPMEATHRNLHTALHILRLELACRQSNNDAALLALSEIGKYSKFLSHDHQMVLLSAIGSMRSLAVCQALCKVLLPCLSLNLVPQLLDMFTDSESRTEVCRRANEVLNAAAEKARDGHTEQYRHWLAAKAFNLGAAEAGTDHAIARAFFQISHDAAVKSLMSICGVLADKASHALESLDGAEHEQDMEVAAPVSEGEVPMEKEPVVDAVPVEIVMEEGDPSPSPSAMIFSSPKAASPIAMSPPEVAVPDAMKAAENESPPVAASPTRSQLPSSPAASHGAFLASFLIPEPPESVSKTLEMSPEKPAPLKSEQRSRISPTKKASAPAAVSPAAQPEFPAASQQWLQAVFAAQQKTKRGSTKRKFVPPRPAAGCGEGSSEPTVLPVPALVPTEEAAAPADDADVLSIDSA